MVSDGAQADVLDPLPVGAGHVIPSVAHDEVDGHLMAGAATDGLEDVAEGVEVQPRAVNAEVLEGLRHLLAYGAVHLLAFEPADASAGEEDQIGVGPRVLGRGPDGEGLLDGLDGFRPEGASAG